MTELRCKDCLFFESCVDGDYDSPCQHFSAYGILEEHLFDLDIENARGEYRMAWYEYVSEFE